jgi:hypothetical protein
MFVETKVRSADMHRAWGEMETKTTKDIGTDWYNCTARTPTGK